MLTSLPSHENPPIGNSHANVPRSETIQITRSRHSLGGSHTVVTYPPLELLEPVPAAPILGAVRPETGINLYAHVAFCEFQCPFCHYETRFRKLRSQADDALDVYMASLAREWDSWKSRLGASTLGSLYIGGGTPTSIPLASLTKLIAHLLDYPREPGFGFCVETSPASIANAEGAETLRTLKGLGVNRFSMGVQTSNAQLLARSRGHSREILLQAIENLQTLSLPYNIDLIQDLPDQNDAALGEDLDFVAEVLPPQVTWYILRLENNAAWRSRYDAGQIDLPTSDVSVRRRLRIIDRMRALGYSIQPGGRFSRSQAEPDVYKRVRSQLGDTLLGLGASAYSHGWNWFFRNVQSAPGISGVKEYASRVKQGISAIADARKITIEDREVSAVLAAVRSRIDLETLAISKPYRDEILPMIDRLVSAGLMFETEGGIEMTDIGRALEEELTSLFYSGAIREQLRAKGAYWAKDSWFGSAALGQKPLPSHLAA